jgi:hypothetical protein
LNRTSIRSSRDKAEPAAHIVTRRQAIAWGAVALGGLAMARTIAITNASGESNPEDKKTGPQVSPRDLDALSTAGVLYIATVRKDGNQSKSAPVWFTVAPDHRVLIQTQPTTWKAKRIRRGSPVIVWIGNKRGPAFIGKAEITSDPAVPRQIIEDYPKRYLMARFGLNKPSQQMFDTGKAVPIIVTPVRDLPEGFATQPGTPAPSLEDGHK